MHSDDSDDSDDGLFDDLEEGLDDNFDLGGFRERRMEELRAQSVLLAYSSPATLADSPTVESIRCRR